MVQKVNPNSRKAIAAKKAKEKEFIKKISVTLNREGWLNKANVTIREWFKALNYTIPIHLRISCGFPGGRGSKKFIGQCWDPEASKDKATELFISPIIDDPAQVLGVLVHEDVHAAVGLACKHRGAFVKCARAVGLEGKMTATVAGEVLSKKIAALLKTLPPYPHARLNLALSPVKKQGTRGLKAQCSECGYTVRISRKWIDEVGAPHCPNHGEMETESSEDSEDKE